MTRTPLAPGQVRQGILLFTYTIQEPYLRKNGTQSGKWWVVCSSDPYRVVLRNRRELEEMKLLDRQPASSS